MLFFTSLAYILIYTLKSTIISFMFLLIYELFAIFIKPELATYISICENGNKVTNYMIITKYLVVLLLSIVLSTRPASKTHRK